MPLIHTLELRIPVTENEQEFLYLAVKAAIKQYRVYRRGHLSGPTTAATLPAPDHGQSQTKDF